MPSLEQRDTKTDQIASSWEVARDRSKASENRLGPMDPPIMLYLLKALANRFDKLFHPRPH